MAEPDLAQLRKDIDAIDAEMHKLIVRRAAISEAIRGLKSDDDLKLRPGREANILRALVERHTGAFPKAQLVRIWREILSASLAMQGPFSVGIFATETAHSFWDLARDHFGTGVQTWKFATARRVVETVATGQCSIGIVPEPDLQSEETWWHHLVVQPNAANRGKPVRVISKLPFVRQTAQHGGVEAYVIARAEPEDSGDDRSLLAIDLAADMSTDALQKAIADWGFSGIVRAKWHDNSAPARWVQLVDVAGFIARDDDRIAHAADVFGSNLNEVIVIGGFAEPIVLQEQARPAGRAPARQS